MPAVDKSSGKDALVRNMHLHVRASYCLHLETLSSE